MDKVFESFVKKIITKESLLFFLEEITRVQQIVFKNTKVPLTERLKGIVSEELRNYLKELEKKKIIPTLPHQQNSFLDKLKKYLQAIPQVKLEIAFTPTEDFILKISNWFEKEFHQRIIIDINVNPKIVGGAIVEYHGKYGNFSLAKKIDVLISQKEL